MNLDGHMVHAKGHSRETFLHLYEAQGTLRDIVSTSATSILFQM